MTWGGWSRTMTELQIERVSHLVRKTAAQIHVFGLVNLQVAGLLPSRLELKVGRPSFCQQLPWALSSLKAIPTVLFAFSFQFLFRQTLCPSKKDYSLL